MNPTKKKNPFQRLLATRGMGQVLTVAAGLVILCIVFAFFNDKFLSPENIGNLLRQIAPILLIGIGQSFVLITGNIDLSIGSVVGMSCMLSATLMSKYGVNPWLALVITILCSLAVGVVNGELVARCHLPPFIATLGTMTICRGIAQIVNGNYNTDAIASGVGKEAAGFFQNFFYYGKINFVIPLYNTVWIAVVLWIVFNFLLRRTRTGRHIYAIGSNVEAAKLSGVNVVSTTTKAYLVSAFCAAVVGLIQTAQAGTGTMDAGNGYELYAVAASVIGGVSTLGGQGLLVGTIIGAAIWSVLQNGLVLAKAPLGLKNIVIGVIVIISVLLDVIVRRGGGRRFKDKATASVPAAPAKTPPGSKPDSEK